MPVVRINEEAAEKVEENRQDGESKTEAASRIILGREPKNEVTGCNNDVDYGEIETIVENVVDRKMEAMMR